MNGEKHSFDQLILIPCYNFVRHINPHEAAQKIVIGLLI